MPQVFKSRRNILRAANKSKREHFAENEDLLDEDNPVLVEELIFKVNVTKRYSGDELDDIIAEAEVDRSFGRSIRRGISLKKGESINFSGDFTEYGLTSLTINSNGNVITLKHGKTGGEVPRMRYWRPDGFQLSRVVQVVTYEDATTMWFDLELDDSNSLEDWKQQTFTKTYNSTEYTLDKWEWTLDVPVPVQNVNFSSSGTLKFDMSGKYTGYLVEYFDTAGNKIKELRSEVTPSESSTIEITSDVPPIASMAKIAAVNGPVASEARKVVRTILSKSDTIKFKQEWGSLIGTDSEGIQTCEQLNNARNLLELGSAPYCGESFQQEPKEFPNSKKKKDEDF